jgi:hypothetical protein
VFSRALRTALCLTVGLGAAGLMPTAAVSAKTTLPPRSTTAAGSSVPTADRDRLLGNGWRGSSDRLVVLRGDADALHLVLADESSGYEFRTVASVSEPGVETDRWIGNYCVTGSGRSIAVVYGPRQMTNNGDLLQRGGFAAVVDVATGKVRKLGLRATLAYFSPGCGAGESAVFTQFKGGDDATGKTAQTRLFTVDTATGRIARPVVTPGQITSAVPGRDGLLGAAAGAVVAISSDGRAQRVVAAESVPYRLVADADADLLGSP